MVLSPELLPYAENMWRRFPEELITLGSADFEDAFQMGKLLLERQLVVTESEVSVRIVLRRGPPVQLDGTPSPRFANHPAAQVQMQMPHRAPDWRSGTEAEAELLPGRSQPRLAEVFSAAQWPEVAGNMRKRGQREAAFRVQKRAGPSHRPREAAGAVQTSKQLACSQRKAPSRAISPSGTTEAPDSDDSGLGRHTSWSRSCTGFSSRSDASLLALRRGLKHLLPLITRPPPAPSPMVFRVPALDRGASLGWRHCGLMMG